MIVTNADRRKYENTPEAQRILAKGAAAQEALRNADAEYDRFVIEQLKREGNL